jgi:hypothetical protein
MFVVKAMLSFAAQYMGCNLGNVLKSQEVSKIRNTLEGYTHAQCHRGKLVIFADWKRENTVRLRLRCV